MTSFSDLGVPEPIARRLDERGLHEPFEIQRATVPDALAGRDVSGRAPTGSGKTIAFGIPLVARVRRSAPKRPKGLVLAPTRELAGQIAKELEALGDLRVLAVYGGTPMAPQVKTLRAGVDIVVACPGRLLDVIDHGACNLRDVDVVVLDEADRMADMGFLPSVRRILDQTPSSRQTLLFSATLDGAVDSIVRDYQRDPVLHELPEEEQGPVDHHLWSIVDRADKVRVTAEIVDRVGSTIVFSRTRHNADRLTRQLRKLGVDAVAIHGDRSQNQRERALDAFHKGDARALVATDVAARGIHVDGVRGVVHFDLPSDPKDWVHRSGRTGRAGDRGIVVGLVPEPERKAARKLLESVGVDVEVTKPDPDLLPEGPRPAPNRRRSGGSGAPGSRDGRSGTGRGSSGGRGGSRKSRSSSDGRSGTGRRSSGRGSDGKRSDGRGSAGRGPSRGGSGTRPERGGGRKGGGGPKRRGGPSGRGSAPDRGSARGPGGRRSS